jgi:4-amino-4-deoxy-L-arabinose transferase-like glycosyltransferase
VSPEDIVDRGDRPGFGERIRAAFVRERLSLLAVLALTVLAAIIRLHDLGAKSFWFDEFLTAHAARLETWNDVVAWLHRWIDHPPLQVVLTWLLRPFGGDEFVVRLPTALVGVASVGAMYALGASFSRPRVGLLAAAMLTASPYAVWYAQEARPYSFVLLLTLLQMLFAYRVARLGRIRDWVALGAVSIVYLYTSYLALATTLAVTTYLGSIAVLGLIQPVPSTQAVTVDRSTPGPDPHRFAIRGLLTGSAIGIAYLLWVPFLLEFISRPDLGFGRIDASHQATIAEFVALLGSVSLGDGIVILLMACGGLVVAFSFVRGHGRSAGLLATWLAIGVGILVVRVHGGAVTIWPRYLMYLVPAGILLAALGANGLVVALGRVIPGGWRAPAEAAGLTIIAFAVLAPAPTLLAQLYDTPKGEDYRAAAQLIAGAARPDQVVLTVQKDSDWLVEGLSHELWIADSSTPVFDAHALDPIALDSIQSAKTVVLAALVDTSASPLESTPPAGWTIRMVRGIELSTSPPTSAPIKAANVGLDWAASTDPDLEKSRLLMQAMDGTFSTRPDVLDTLTGPGWIVPAGASMDGAGRLRLEPSGTQLDATVTVPVGSSPRRVILTFECESALTAGSLRLYVSAHATNEAWLAIFPTGAGYECPTRPGFHPGVIVVDPPPGADHLIVRIRADGTGLAEARSIRLTAVDVGD